MRFTETSTIGVSNSIGITGVPITESKIADIPVSKVRAVYPFIRAINSGRLTKNYTFYPGEALDVDADDYGYNSFVLPYGKPILREHRVQDSSGLFSTSKADAPMGRTVFAGYHKHSEALIPTKPLYPGSLKGDGALVVVASITDPEAITKVLGGTYHTVSIGVNAESVIESISGKDIVELSRKGIEPKFHRGQIHNNKLSYWTMGGIQGVELSFVNVPSDEYAFTTNPDIGEEGIRLLLAEKKYKSKEFSFFDAKTLEQVDIEINGSWDPSFLIDSTPVQEYWQLSIPDYNTQEKFMKGVNYKEQTLGLILETLNDITAEEALESLKPILENSNKTQIQELLSNPEKFTHIQVDKEAFDLCQEIGNKLSDIPETALSIAVGLYEEKVGKLSAPKTLRNFVESDKDIAILDAPLEFSEGSDVFNTLVELAKELVNQEIPSKVSKTIEATVKVLVGNEALEGDVLEKVISLEKISNTKTVELSTEGINVSSDVTILPESYWKDKFLAIEFSEEQETLTKLVGVARKLNLTKEEVENSAKGYNLFTKSSLLALYNSIPDKRDVENKPEETAPIVLTPSTPSTEQTQPKRTTASIDLLLKGKRSIKKGEK